MRVINIILRTIILFSLILLICGLANAENSRDSFFGKDKLDHFVISAAMTGGTGFVAYNHFHNRRFDSIAIGFSLSLSLGGIKEIVDKSVPGQHSSWKDLAADLVGCTVGALILAGATK